MVSRQEFIKRSGLGTGLLLSPHLLTCAMQKMGENNLHLLFKPSQTAEIKHRLQLPLFEPLWQEMLNADLKDDRRFLQTGIAFNNQLRHLSQADRILQREAFIYAMTGDQKRGDMALLALEKVFQFEKWDYLQAGKDVIGLQRLTLNIALILLTTALGNSVSKKCRGGMSIQACFPALLSLVSIRG